MKMSHRTRRAPRRDPRPGARVHPDQWMRGAQWTPEEIAHIQRGAVRPLILKPDRLENVFARSMVRMTGADYGKPPLPDLQPYQRRWLEASMRDLVPDSFDLQPGSTDMHSVWLDPEIGAIRRRVIPRAEWERQWKYSPATIVDETLTPEQARALSERIKRWYDTTG